MDTMLILHITLLLLVAVVPSYSDNKTASVESTTTTAGTPVKITTVKIIDVTNASDDDSPTAKLKRGLGIQSLTLADTSSFSKRQDPSFSGPLTSFDQPSGIISPDSITGFTGGKSSIKDSFDIDDIDVKSNPSFDIDSPSIKGSSSFSIEGSNIKDTTSFDIDSPSFSLDGASFSIDGGIFNLDSPTFDVEGTGVKENPSFNIDTVDFDIDEPTAKSTSSFESDFHNAKRSPSYDPESVVKSNPSYNVESSNLRNSPYKSESYKSEVYKPEASSIRSTSSISPSYDSVSNKNYNYPKSSRQSYTTPQNSYSKPVYSSTSPGPVYSNSRVQYVGSQATPNTHVYNNYGTTPYYENYVTPASSQSAAERSRAISNIKSTYSNPFEASSSQKIEGSGSGQNSFKNNLLNEHGAFRGQYPTIQNLNPNSFPQGSSGESLQYSGSQATQNPIYKSQYPGPKNSQQVYSPTHQTAISFSPSTQSFEKLSQNLAYTSSPLEYNKRATSLPVIQIQNVQDFPGFIQALETEPIVLTTGSNINFQSVPNFGLSFDFGKGSGNQPFLAANNNYQQPQVLPVQTSSSTPQFPQYKGASIQAHSRSDYAKRPDSYQPLVNQPQLHFNVNPIQSVNKPQVFDASKPSERIKEDVEIITNKKVLVIPQNDDNEEEEEVDDEDDDELDEEYKSVEREYGQSGEDESSEPQTDSGENGSSENYSAEEPEFKSSMPPMPPFVFKPYDEKVGRLHEFVRQPEPQNHFSEESSAEDDEEYSPRIYSSTKPPIAEYDQNSHKPYLSYAPPNPSITTFDENDEDEEESRKYEKQEDESNGSDFPVKGLKALRGYERRYEKKFDEPYKKDPLQNKYAYVNKVPDVIQSSAEDRTTYPKISKYSRGNNYTPRPTYRSSYDSVESTERSVRPVTKKLTKRPYKNSEERDIFRTDPRVIHEESFGYKIPKKVEENKKLSAPRKAPTEDFYSRFTKDNDGTERYSNVKKTPTEDSYVHARRGSYKSDSPKKGDTTSYENGDSYSYSSGKNWKSNKKIPEAKDSQSRPSQEAKNVAYITEDNYNFFSPEKIRPGLSGSIFRDFINAY